MSIFVNILLTPIYLLVAYISIWVIRDIYSFYLMTYYIKQGIPYRFIPWFGFNYVVGAGKGKQDENMFFWQFIKQVQEKKHKLTLWNTSKNIGGVLVLSDPELVQEFIKIEHQVANK